MNKIRTIILTIAIIGITPVFVSAQKNLPTSQRATFSTQECNLRLIMNNLWTDHVMWERFTIISAIANLEDAEIAKMRLLQNQDYIGNALASYYGPQIGTQITHLLKQHILIATELVASLITNNKARFDYLNQQWHANALEVASFLSQINPYWNKQILVNMFYKHLQFGAQIAQYRLQRNWQQEVANFDQMVMQAQMMAQMFADGIIKQFPQKF